MDKNRIIVRQSAVIIVMIVVLMVVLFCLVATYLWGSQHVVYEQTGKVRCSNFPTQEQAQQAFNSNPAEYASLDGNHDGVACSDLPKT